MAKTPKKRRRCHVGHHDWRPDGETDYHCFRCDARGRACPACDGSGDGDNWGYAGGLGDGDCYPCHECDGNGIVKVTPARLVAAGAYPAELHDAPRTERAVEDSPGGRTMRKPGVV